MFPIVLAILFIIRLRFPKSHPITDIISRRYGRSTLQLYRRTEKLRFRTKKIEEDLKFLTTCKDYHTLPNFIKFKVYSRNSRNNKTYKSSS